MDEIAEDQRNPEPVPTVAQATIKVAGTILVGNSAAAPALVRDVNAASATHLGRKASEMVSLNLSLQCHWRDLFHENTSRRHRHVVYYSVRQGLTITDVNWQIESGNPGTVARLLLRIENLANPIFIRNVQNSVLTLTSAGVNALTERLGTGIAVSSAAKITAILNTPSGALGSPYLIGYLAPDV